MSAALAALALLTATAAAWNAPGHRTVTELALDSLPSDAPAFFRDPALRARVLYECNEPDQWRSTKSDVLSHENGPDHYIDSENLDKHGLKLDSLPHLRYIFVAQLAKSAPDESTQPRRGVTRFFSDEVGFLPYAIAEHYAKLVSSFNTMRIIEGLNDPARAEQLEAARSNAMYEMGQLSHFVGDAGQPLHTTIHHHGWVGENPKGYTTDRGIHAHIDGAVLATHALNEDGLKEFRKPMREITPEKTWDEAIALIQRSFDKMEPVYVMQKSGDLERQPGRAMIGERMADCASVLSGLYWCAWNEGKPSKTTIDDFLKYNEIGVEKTWSRKPSSTEGAGGAAAPGGGAGAPGGAGAGGGAGGAAPGGDGAGGDGKAAPAKGSAPRRQRNRSAPSAPAGTPPGAAATPTAPTQPASR